MRPDTLTELDERGYTVLPQLMTAEEVGAFLDRIEELFALEGENAGKEFRQEPQTRRLANLVNKGRIFEEMIVRAEVLQCVRAIIGPDIKLSSLNARSAEPYSDWVQPLHADMGAIRDDQGYWVANSVWILDDFTEENGALRLIPGSHRWGKLPQDVLPDPKAQHPDEILITAPAGAVVVMNAHMWHGGTANRTDKPRRALHAFYTRRDKPQQQYQKGLLDPAVQQRLRLEVRSILALDDPANDALSAQAGGSGFLR